MYSPLRWLATAAYITLAACRPSAPPPVQVGDGGVAGALGTPPRAALPLPLVPAVSDGGELTPGGRLDELVREHIEATLLESPTTATWLGVHGGDDRLDDVSLEAQSRRLLRLRAQLDRLRPLRDETLDPAHRFDRALLERELRAAIFEASVERPLERNPGRYLDVITAGIDDLLRWEGAPLGERLRLITLRLAGVRAVLDESRRNLRVPSELATRRAIEAGQTTRGFLADTLPKLLNALGDDRLTTDYRIVEVDAAKALDDWMAWLTRDVLPHATREVPLGRDRLLEKLRSVELVDLPLERLLAVAEREQRATRLVFEEVARLVAPGKSVIEAVRTLDDDHPTADDLLPTVSASLDGVIAFVRDQRLLTPPETRPKVAEMPPYLWGFASLTPPGALEPRPTATFLYIDPVDRAWDTKRRDEHLRMFHRAHIRLTLLHQAYPGHFVQAEASRRAPTALQRVARSNAFVEGWSGYVEQLVVDECAARPPAICAAFGGADPRLRLAVLRETLVRQSRLVAALRLHGPGAKGDDIIKLFTDEAYLDDYSARKELERVTLDPMCLLPALGKLELQKLRADYRQEKGDAFTLREFHDKVLAHGAPPPALLRRILLPSPSGDPL